MWNTNQWKAAALQLAETGSTSTLSNTVCVSDPDGHWPQVQEKSVKDLQEFGEIARLDTSLAVIARCVLVTYFDVRCAQRLMLSSLGRCEPFPPAAHDIRTVRVDLSAFAEKVDHVRGGFNQFGEVAHISASHGFALVEFYDIRAAQTLLAASQGTAVPWTPEQTTTAPALLASLGSGNWPLPNSVPQGLMAYQTEMLPEEAADTTDAQTQDADTKGERANKPVRTKVSTKEFQKYDIDPDRIQRGEDSRTTVMIRNLVGISARKDFLMFLEKCGLSDRFTFFYMPCKEHRNVPAGFAFVNFISSIDVHKLVVMVKSGFWREFMKEPTVKAPAVSYARFQGHEELVKHFSSSAVLHEQDPEKRPIFRPEAAAKAAKEKKLASAKKDESSLKPRATSNAVPHAVGLQNSMPPGLETFVATTNVAGEDGTAPLSTLLGSQVNEIAALLTRLTDAEAPKKIAAAPPAYVKSAFGPGQNQEALQFLLAKTMFQDNACFAPKQMGA